MSGFKQRLGLIDATSIVAGSMIGSGIFLVSAQMSRDVGSAGWLMLAWIISGVITLAAALSYGELAGMMPEAGGQYVYIRRAFGKLTAFLYGWTVFSVIQTGVIAAVAIAFANYTSELFPALGSNHIIIEAGWLKVTRAHLVAVALIFLLTFWNTRGVEGGAWVAKIFTSAKLLALFALIALGLSAAYGTGVLDFNFTNAWDASRTVESAEEPGTFITTPIAGIGLMMVLGLTMINSLFSSDAWNNVTFIAGEIKEPHKNIPRSLILGTAIVTVLYLLANLAYLSLLKLDGDPVAIAQGAEITRQDIITQGIQHAENDRIGSSAAYMIFGSSASIMMAVLIMVSTFGCNNGIILAGGRLFYAMSKDGLFFPRAGKLNENGVPAFALWIQAIWACALCFSGKYGDLLSYATFASLIFYCVTIAGLFVLRRKEPDAHRPYKALGYPIVPALYIIVAAAICVDLIFMDTRNSVAGLILVGLGVPIYFILKNVIDKKAIQQ
jgi:APA family basic amino acid/polyamine antiporter